MIVIYMPAYTESLPLPAHWWLWIQYHFWQNNPATQLELSKHSFNKRIHINCYLSAEVTSCVNWVQGCSVCSLFFCYPCANQTTCPQSPSIYYRYLHQICSVVVGKNYRSYKGLLWIIDGNRGLDRNLNVSSISNSNIYFHSEYEWKSMNQNELNEIIYTFLHNKHDLMNHLNESICSKRLISL